ncbi:Carbamoyl-phosphate synthase [Phytophthora infestans]|uniref:Carbamoyl-phosphate synthase n=1 Tax=Phytophthora infestans TaxID=4787 RepID=A0A833ST42_PHYIN|nr:Carbamoyl-phosphate synthase [Phytophthora infestans]KAF4145520.1 Carbamoyl-phosphate synthase L chain ATP binding domain-containing protein [Phytophthora infestans]
MDTTAQRFVLVVCRSVRLVSSTTLARTSLLCVRKALTSYIATVKPSQTALSVGIELYLNGDQERHNVRAMGTLFESIIETGGREKPSAKILECRKTIALRQSVLTVEGALKAAKAIGYTEKSYTRNGSAWKYQTKQILINQDLRDWKEVEYEVVRDAKDICFTVSGWRSSMPKLNLAMLGERLRCPSDHRRAAQHHGHAGA